MIRFFTFSQFHNKKPVVGSTFIRVNQLLKYWPEAGLYKYGENPDVLIFQKVYCSADYKFPVHFENIKILDICDPDWLEGIAIKETIEAVGAVTVPTEALQTFIKQMTDKPVVVIPDRFDIEVLPKPKKHTEDAKSVVWFGYSHNANLLRPALPLIDELKLRLIIISNQDPYLTRIGQRDPEVYEFIKYDEKTIYNDLLKADFCILPDGNRVQDKYKSNNKSVKAILTGLPVAKTKEEVQKFMKAKNRTSYLRKHYGITRADYDVRKSVEQYKSLIQQLNES